MEKDAIWVYWDPEHFQFFRILHIFLLFLLFFQFLFFLHFLDDFQLFLIVGVKLVGIKFYVFGRDIPNEFVWRGYGEILLAFFIIFHVQMVSDSKGLWK